MPVRRVLIVLTVLLGLLAASACTTRTSRCSGSACTVDLSGEQTVEVEIGTFERDLRVAPIEADAVTVSARGDSALLTVGGTATVGGLAVTLRSVAGQDVGLEVRRS
ncbi:hypothetical protein [Pseudonocardia nigra]|uniref:hypothetical protein n=1 Tax=Pseudonocardia nigra TaxID=1921578 RepID=UPI001C5F8A0E|nr:hypothetical protein [Pseudonocardia nigra]